MNLNLMQTGQSLKTRLSLYLALTLTKSKISIFFSKNQTYHIACSARERAAWFNNICPRKGHLTCHTDRETPCRLGLVWLIRFVESWLMTQMEILWLTQFFWFNSIFELTHFVCHGSNMNHDSYLSPESNMSHDSNMNHNSNMSHNSNMNHNSKVRHNWKIEF